MSQVNSEESDSKGKQQKQTTIDYKELDKKGTLTSENRFHIVAIGASAGGYEAIEHFFSVLPPDNDMAYIVIQHLSPDFKSLMVELLSKKTSMPVYRVTNGLEIRKNCVYLIPPKKIMTIFANRLYLQDLKKNQVVSFPVNTFFRSLAEQCGEYAIGIVLSGTGTDGTIGLKDIKGYGGITIVQQPESAKFDGMPANAIANSVADYVLKPQAMPGELIRIRNSFKNTNLRVTTSQSRISEIYSKILYLLKSNTDIDYSTMKSTTLFRRIEKRMILTLSDSLESYSSLLENSPAEVCNLGQELLVGVTKFFRDEEAFRVIEKDIFPKLISDLDEKEDFRLWIPGCSTGEEVYSFAILLKNYLTENNIQKNVKIFATDIDKTALQKASQAMYQESILNDIEENSKKTYFIKIGKNVKVSEKIREMIVFAFHDITHDPPFNHIHFISCRNVLIYLKPDVVNKVISTFHIALEEDGYLFLGKSESIPGSSEVFSLIDAKNKIFKKKESELSQKIYDSGLKYLYDQDISKFSLADTDYRINRLEFEFQTLYREIMLPYEPSAILVDEHYRPQFFFGNSNKYLKGFSRGKISITISTLVVEGLDLALNIMLSKAKKTGTTIIYDNVRITLDNQEEKVNVTVKPISKKSIEAFQFLIVIEEQSIQKSGEKPDTQIDFSEEPEKQIHELDQELRLTRENLKTTVEELETTNEELQATNEELLASNEELQSTNEELHSVNEELITVNAEHQAKIEQLIELTNDLDNLITSTQIPIIFLDKELKLRKFTSSITEIFNIISSDVGRYIGNFTHNLAYPNLMQDIKTVLSKGEPRVTEAKQSYGKHFLVRIYPYLVFDESIEGIVLTFPDITRRKDAEERISQILQNFIDNSPSIIFVKDVNGAFLMVNSTYERYQNISRDEIIGKTEYELYPETKEFVDEVTRHDKEVLTSLKTFTYEESAPIGGETLYFLSTKFPLLKSDGEAYAVCCISQDITKQRKTEKKLHRMMYDYDLLIENITYPVVLTDEDFKIIKCNQSALEVCNLSEFPHNEETDVLEILRKTDINPQEIMEKLQDTNSPVSFTEIMPDKRFYKITITGVFEKHFLEQKRYIISFEDITHISLMKSMVQNNLTANEFFILDNEKNILQYTFHNGSVLDVLETDNLEGQSFEHLFSLPEKDNAFGNELQYTSLKALLHSEKSTAKEVVLEIHSLPINKKQIGYFVKVSA